MAGYPCSLMTPLAIGLIFDLLGSYPRQPADPPDIDVEYEPEETVHALEAAIRSLGHTPIRIGNPEALLARIGKGELPALDAAMNIAEGRGGRNRKAWAPVLLEMAGVSVPEEQDIDGVSLVPLLEGGDFRARPLFWHYPHYGNQGGEPSSIVMEGDWKLIRYPEDGREEL